MAQETTHLTVMGSLLALAYQFKVILCSNLGWDTPPVFRFPSAKGHRLGTGADSECRTMVLTRLSLSVLLYTPSIDQLKKSQVDADASTDRFAMQFAT